MYTTKYTEQKRFIRYNSTEFRCSIWVDPGEISSIEPRCAEKPGEYNSVLHMKNGHTIFVEESPDEVVTKFSEE